MEAVWPSRTLVYYIIAYNYMVSQPRRPWHQSLSPWKPEVSQVQEYSLEGRGIVGPRITPY